MLVKEEDLGDWTAGLSQRQGVRERGARAIIYGEYTPASDHRRFDRI